MTPNTFALKQLKTLISAFIIIFSISSQNANAVELDFDNIETKKLNLNVSFERSFLEATSSLPFKEPDLAQLMGYLKDKYLTFYSNKNESLNATYVSGMYYLKYTHNW